MSFISEGMNCSSLYVVAFPIGPQLGVPSYSVGGGGTGSWENLYLYHGEPADSFA